MKIKIFSDQSYAPQEGMIVPILAPFFGTNNLENSDFNLQQGRFDSYLDIADRLFTLTSLQEADIAIYPGAWQICKFPQGEQLLFDLAAQAKAVSKPLAIFVGGDLDENVPVQDAAIFHTSLYRSRKKKQAFSMPALIDDLVDKYLHGKLSIRQKQDQPTVGFCGHAPPLGMSWNLEKVKETIRLGLSSLGMHKFLPIQSAHTTRVRALLNLAKSQQITTNFKLRNRSGMVWAYDSLLPQKEVNYQQQRKDFIDNLVNSDYIICARGYGNYSVRLYETLCCGRIPVFIDTDCVLPYDFALDWKKYCVWVDEGELPFIAEKIVDFHSQLSPQKFIDLQYECRQLWQKWLSPEGFFSNFYRHFPTIYHSQS